ncbi:MAG: A/G-specific adenine glycosylase [Rhodospirillales bacterium]|nr:A/G-specific adenine glycosylase [Rhodospirillales bacterium]
MQPKQAADKMTESEIEAFRRDLLDWYDRHRRTLPWRAGPAQTADPYHVWLSEIMLQQTVVAAVIPFFLKFVDKWPTVHDLAAADQQDVMDAWAGLGYYSRARNLHKCAQVIAHEYNGVFPQVPAELKKLPGIGDYTSAAITAIAFDRPATVIDGNVDRVISRYFAITEPLPDSKPQIRQYAGMLSEARADRPGDFAQAMMDLGATICTPKSPKCILCPLSGSCKGHESGIHQTLPHKKAKPQKPTRYGYIYWITDRNGRVLCHRRPPEGLLGGMTGLPTSEWGEDIENIKHFLHSDQNAPVKTKAQVRHVFTHFNLMLDGYLIDIKENRVEFPEDYYWVSRKNMQNIEMPTVFKKFVRLML